MLFSQIPRGISFFDDAKLKRLQIKQSRRRAPHLEWSIELALPGAAVAELMGSRSNINMIQSLASYSEILKLHFSIAKTDDKLAILNFWKWNMFRSSHAFEL